MGWTPWTKEHAEEVGKRLKAAREEEAAKRAASPEYAAAAAAKEKEFADSWANYLGMGKDGLRD